MQNVSLILISLVIATGCASKGFNRGALQDQAAVTKPQFDDKEIKDAFGKKANLPKPFKLAVYFKQPKPTAGTGSEWRWSEKDQEQLHEFGKELKAKGVISEFFPILGSLVADEDLKTIRMAAAKQQADAVLIVGGAGQIDRYINNWGWTYALILPTLFVKGSEADVLFVANATLWDVRNGYLYMTGEAESEKKNKYIAAYGKQDKELVDQAKSEALSNLNKTLQNMSQGTKL